MLYGRNGNVKYGACNISMVQYRRLVLLWLQKWNRNITSKNDAIIYVIITRTS